MTTPIAAAARRMPAAFFDHGSPRSVKSPMTACCRRIVLTALFAVAGLFVPARVASAEDASRVLFITITGGYNADGVNLFNELSTQTTAQATHVVVSGSGGQVVTALQNGTYDQLWIYDLSTGADAYAADYAAIESWFAAHSSRHIICDARILSSIWNARYSTEGRGLVANYFHNLAVRGGGLVLTTDHDDFARMGANDIASRIGIGPVTGNFGGTLALETDSVLMTTPNTIVTLSNDSSTGQVPFGLQPNGLTLLPIGYHSGNVNTPGISTTIDNTPPTALSAGGLASPAAVQAGDGTTLTAIVTRANNPASTGVTVACDLTAIGGSATQSLLDTGAAGDVDADDDVFTFVATVDSLTAAGQATLDCTAEDAQARSSTFQIAIVIDASCGDGRIEGTEVCDDGGTGAGDGCSPSCTEEVGWACAGAPSACTTTCGDGEIAGLEVCDDANTTVGDGCSDTCSLEPGWSCGGSPTSCTTTCGDGVRAGAEACDDDAAVDGDGCSAACESELGWSCTGATPDTCAPGCGDGLLRGAEDCDDGNADDGDGCSAACVTETGWSCSDEPSSCVTSCGDGVVAGAEACDDGNQSAGDGCAASCTVELGWDCDAAAPSACITACGDAVQAGTETCDDGNTTSGDGCSATCTVENDNGGGGDGSGSADDNGDGGGGGCAATNSSGGGTSVGLILLGAVLIRRRRRGCTR